MQKELTYLNYNNKIYEYNQLTNIKNFTTIIRVLTEERINRIPKKLIPVFLDRLAFEVQNENSRTLNKKEEIEAFFTSILYSVHLPKFEKGSMVVSSPLEKDNLAPKNDTFDIEPIIPVHTKIRRSKRPKILFTDLSPIEINKESLFSNTLIYLLKELKFVAKNYKDVSRTTIILIRTIFEVSLKYWLDQNFPNLYS